MNTPSSIDIKAVRVVPTTEWTSGNTFLDTVEDDSVLSMGAVSSATGKDFYAQRIVGDTSVHQTSSGTTLVDLPVYSEATLNGGNYDGYYKANLLVRSLAGEAKGLKVTVKNNSDNAIKNDVYVAVYQVGTNFTELAPGSTAPGVNEGTSQEVGSFGKVFGATNYSAIKNAAGDTQAVTVSAFNTEQTVNATFSKSDKDVYGHFVVAIWMEGTVNANQNAARGKIISAEVTFSLYTA